MSTRPLFRQFIPSPALRSSLLLLVALLLMCLCQWYKHIYEKNIRIEIAAQNGDLVTVEELVKATPALVSSRYYIGTH